MIEVRVRVPKHAQRASHAFGTSAKNDINHPKPGSMTTASLVSESATRKRVRLRGTQCEGNDLKHVIYL